MSRRLLMSVPFVALTLASAAEARRLPGPTLEFGPNCAALYRATRQPVLFVGTALGGQNRRGRWGDGTFRDERTYQGCFTTEAGCQRWVARQGRHHPLPPGYQRCTLVRMERVPSR